MNTMKAADPSAVTPIDKSSQTGTDRAHRNEINTTGEPEKYDVLVLGAGTGGKLIAWTMASEGKRTASIERKYIGGACPNIACLPSKNIIHSAKVASLFGRHQEFATAVALRPPGGSYLISPISDQDKKRYVMSDQQSRYPKRRDPIGWSHKLRRVVNGRQGDRHEQID